MVKIPDRAFDELFSESDVPASLIDCFEEVKVQCGAPWARIVKRKRVATRPGADSKVHGTNGEVHGNRDPGRHVTKRVTKGWKPGCECFVQVGHKRLVPNPVPCVVLDPFGGHLATAVVAKRLGRYWLACELNPEYAKAGLARVGKVNEGYGLFAD